MKRKLEEGIQNNPTASLDNYLLSAEYSLLSMDIRNVLMSIKQQLDKNPNNGFQLVRLADMWLKLGKPDEALIQIEHAFNIVPSNHNSVDYLNIYAKILNKLNRPYDALTHIERSLNLNNQYTETHMLHAQILMKMNKINEAYDVINRLFEIISNKTKHNSFYMFHYHVVQTQAEVLLRLNKLDEALVAIKRALEKGPDDNRNLSIHAQILLRLNKFDEAAVEIKKAIDKTPDSAEDLNIYAQILLELNRYDEAYKTIRCALDIEPDNATHWYVSTQLFITTNQLDNALLSIEKALATAPADVSYLQTYAIILLQLNQSEKALIQTERALEIEPDNTSSLNTRAQTLLQLNKLDEAQTTIERVLKITPYDNFAGHIHAAILTKRQAEQTRAACVENTFISKKYFNAELTSIHNPSGERERQTVRNEPLITLCSFQKIKDVKRGSSLQDLKPIAIKVNQSEFTYYTKAPMLPFNKTPCIFIMAGRQCNAAIPRNLPTPNRIILVITEEELKSVYLAHENDISPAILLPEGTDLLVINRLESHAYGRYDKTSLINARRVAALCVAFRLGLNYLMLMDDNVEALHSNNGTLTNFNQLWAMHQPNQLISSIVTISNRSFDAEDKKRLGSKVFLMNAVQLQQAFNFIKPEELAFFLFLPPHCSNLVMEDYYFQLLINHGLYLSNSLFQGHVALDEQAVSLTRSSAHKSAAKKSANSFGAFAWLSLTTRTFITDSLAKKVSANDNCKEFVSLLIKDVVSDIQKITIKNLDNTNKHLGMSKTATLSKVQSGSKKNHQLQNKQQLWEQIKKAPNLKLRQPQIKAIELWINEKSRGYLHSFSIATGVGKTYIKAIMAYLELACTDQPVIVVTADQKLVNNITDQFTSIFTKLNTHTQLNISPNRIIPVMSSGNRAINQGSLAASDGFKTTQNLYVFCEDSFLKLIQERKVDVNHSSLILLDEYHCYAKTLDEAIKAMQGFAVYVGQMDEGVACYYIDVPQDCISLFDAQGRHHPLDLKPSHIFDSTQTRVMRGMVTNGKPVQINDKALLDRFQVRLQLEQQKMPFPACQQDNSKETPFYWGQELPATSIKIVDHLPAVMPNERTTYVTPTGIYQTNQAGITQCVITQDELIEHWRKSLNASNAVDENQLVQSMIDYYTATINSDTIKRELNQLIISYNGLPCIGPDEWSQADSPECFILTNDPPQLIYRNMNGQEKEIASGFDLYQIWGFELMTVRKNCFERMGVHQCLDLNKVAALKQLCIDKQLASYPNIIRESNTNMIGFSATPPKQNPLKCVFTYSKESAEQAGYITPSIVRLMEIKDFKKIPYKKIFKDVLTMNGPEGVPLSNRKGLYRFKSINELHKAEQLLKKTYNNLSISAVYTPKGKEPDYNEQLTLKNFSTIPYNQGAVLLIVSKLQKGWDEPRLSYTVDFKKNAGINSAVQFLGRSTRVCYDKNEQKQLVAGNKIGLGFFPTSATNLKQHLVPLRQPLPQNKMISPSYSSKAKGHIEAGDYNLNSKKITYG